jgi:DNA-binding NtrC family response regulator
VANPKVLVVDDEADVLESVGQLLELDLDYRVVTAPSAASALTILDQGGIDVVLSDFRMPDMDGCTFLRQVRAEHPEVARILMTAYPNVELEETCRGLGVHTMCKPVDPDHLKEAMRDAVRGAPQRRAS